ncbi:MAG: hypothetical protein P8046_06600 [Anaerolineales bacterium]
MKKMILITSILAILGLIAACSLSPVITNSSTDQPSDNMEPEVSVEQPDDQATEPPAELPAESVFGPDTFSLDLPAGWDVAGPLPVEDARPGSDAVLHLPGQRF